jgi:hypothetical protein
MNRKTQRKDRRLRRRQDARIPFVLSTEQGDEAHGFTRNVSLLGISGYTHAPFKEAQPVRCRLNIPGDPQPIVAHGAVIYCRPLSQPHPEGTYGIGVFFREFEGSGEAKLSTHLQELRQKEQAQLEAAYQDYKRHMAAKKRERWLRKLRQAMRRRSRMLRRLKRMQAKKKAKKRAARHIKRKAALKGTEPLS